MVMFSIQHWALAFIVLAGTLTIAAMAVVLSRPRTALVLFGCGCLSAVVAGAILTHLGSQEAGPEAYAGMRKALSRDPAMLPLARQALADGRLSNQEAAEMADIYNGRLVRRKAAQAEARRRGVGETTEPDRRP